ncbi:MAG: glycoside hydrolase family 2 [Verrucomicrobiales bacterium]|nr:glycoside hydrolase family 2 [Verrucomicrobiales bacterium]
MTNHCSLLFIALLTVGHAQEWKPAGDGMMSAWAKSVVPNKPLPDYPRPQLVRQVWGNLNGQWEYAITEKEAAQPEAWDGKILVPFAVESALSGVGKRVGKDQRLWYKTPFSVPKQWQDDRVLLHFGGVDWHAQVFVNGKPVGEHRGGYTPFHCEISKALTEAEDQELVVSVWDPTDAGTQPRGKQVENPQGIWYTPVTGIWQTVWLEPIPEASITQLKTIPDIDTNSLRLTVSTDGDIAGLKAKVEVLAGRKVVAELTGALNQELQLDIDKPRLWSPQDPFIHTIRVHLIDENGSLVDSVVSYAGMRKISYGKDAEGVNRLMLNNEPLFMFGPLDQGWWPDGLYTAPTDAALQHDITVTKQLGFNMARKHVKVEPARWYFWCDLKGLLVWQDMPNGDRPIKRDEEDITRTAESEAQYRQEYEEMVTFLHNHPSIVTWVPFNEGWGQFKTDEILAWAKDLDPSRLIDGPSGWTDRGTGDMHDIHVYPGPAMPPVSENRVAVLGEYGGLGLPLEDHLWWDKRNWGYRTYETADELWRNYQRITRQLFPLIKSGLAAAIYTQTTDVEGEVNGLMTYDRKRVKFDVPAIRALNEQVYGPLPTITRTTLLPTSEEMAQKWRYTVEAPGEDWYTPDFDDTVWKEGEAGFGTNETPNTVVQTEWSTNDLWIRRQFTLDSVAVSELNYRIYHDEDATIYINGRQVDQLAGYTSNYENLLASSEAVAALKEGKNLIAIHAKQTEGGQFIDCGLLDVQFESKE